MIVPGEQIGILGGGQLGLFFAASAKQMGYKIVVWDSDPNAPASLWADAFIAADFEDPQAMQSFLKDTQAVTYEWENIPARLVEGIEKTVRVCPGSRVLRLLQNRVVQKQFLKDQRLPVTPFEAFQDSKALPGLVDALGLPCIVKTATSGYDGRGQWSIESLQEAHTLSESLQSQPHFTGWIIEKRVSYLKELSVIVAQSESGEVHAYPIAENQHENGILRMSRVPAQIDSDVVSHVVSIAKKTLKALGEAGVFCVEMFLLHHGEILINEIAPRPHNSGHYTMDVCSVSQFEQQVRMLCGLPLIEPRLFSDAILINLLGDEINRLHASEPLRQILSRSGIRLYHYRKQAVRAGRKMGHLLIMEQAAEKAMEQAQEILALIRGCV